MKWEVRGVMRSTGADTSITLDADTEESATRRGNRRGIMVESTRAIDPSDSIDGVTSALHAARPTLSYGTTASKANIPKSVGKNHIICSNVNCGFVGNDCWIW